jgi:hypothetical protein
MDTAKARAVVAAAKVGDAAKIVNLIGPQRAREFARHLRLASAAAKEWHRQNTSAPAPKRPAIPRARTRGCTRQSRPKRRALSRSSSRSGDSGDSDGPEPARSGDRVGGTSRRSTPVALKAVAA